MLNIKKTALSVGVFVGIWYSLLGLGFAFFGNVFWRGIIKLHMVEWNVTLNFSWLMFLVGIVAHVIVGCVAGAVFALIWNFFQKH